jgi:hypothetical protein
VDSVDSLWRRRRRCHVRLARRSGKVVATAALELART